MAQRGKLSLVTFEEFPLGSCGDACLLLGRYLRDVGLGEWEYVCGWRRDHSHAWLQRGKLIIDIAAAQFHEVTDSVIVTQDSTWHSDFVQAYREPINYQLRFGLNPELEVVYTKILQAIDIQGE